MTVVVWIFALIAAAVHVLVFCWETLLFTRPGVHSGVFAIPTADVPPVRLWAFNVGFYNLFLAGGLVAGVIAWSTGSGTVGRTLIMLRLPVHVPGRHRLVHLGPAGHESPQRKGRRWGHLSEHAPADRPDRRVAMSR